MSFAGRSPLNDVVRSVLVGAAMITPAMLAACQKEGAPPPPRVPAPGEESATPVASESVAAPPTASVRPREDPSVTVPKMPVRGFSGAARVRA